MCVEFVCSRCSFKKNEQPEKLEIDIRTYGNLRV
jgi:hypothetical protein